MLERFSSFNRLVRVTAWIFRFANNCRRIGGCASHLTADEISHAKRYWVALAQQSHFAAEIRCLSESRELPSGGPLVSLRPVLDVHGILRVGRRLENSGLSYSHRYPAILPGAHLVTKLLIRTEHLHLLHAGPILVTALLSRHFYILGA